jgi:hypothetical protein
MYRKLARFSAAGILVLGIGVGGRSYATATVGQTSYIAMPKELAPAQDQTKAAFLRPEAIPFPPNNPYSLSRHSAFR